MTELGPLIAADEQFVHQITDTFATVSQSDRAWTEKVFATAAAKDGSLALAFGLGKYPNRNVLDGFAGASRGVEQWTVRSSRRLSPTPEALTVGPVHYEVVEPLHKVRFRLEHNESQPIAFDWLFEGAVPPFLEERDVQRSLDGSRVSADLVRYHQSGTATGWVELEGERHRIDPDGWFSTRDHSWGVRYQVGAPLTDTEPALDVETLEGVAFRFGWSPAYMQRADGSVYALHHFFHEVRAPGFEQRKFQGGVEHPDGSRERFVDLEADLSFDPANRRLLGGTLDFVMADHSRRPVTIEALSDTGFHLGTGLYFGLDGKFHGMWRGEQSVEGEYIPDCSVPEAARRVHQIRDCIVRVHDPRGRGEGWANYQTTITGAWPDLGLTQETSFW